MKRKIKLFAKYLSLKNRLQIVAIVVLFSFLNLSIGCHYYKVKTANSVETSFKEIRNQSKYIILHQGEKAWHLKNIVLNEETKELRGVIEKVDYNHRSYINAGPGFVHRYKPRMEDPTYEVHIFATEFIEEDTIGIIIPIVGIHKIEIYDKDIGTTIVSHIGTIMLVAASLAAVLAILILLFKSSCPFIYIYDGNAYHFSGELYGGAIYSSLERDDYLPLPSFKAVNNEYQLKISNELLEKQYTNLAQLVLIEHPDSCSVLVDKTGNIQTFCQPVSPYKAVSDNHTDYTSVVLAKDHNACLFNESNKNDNMLCKLLLSFKKPADAKTGKLILNAKNSLWLDYIYGKFNEQFGTYYNEFAKKQKKVPAEKNKQWSLEQGIPLAVYVEKENGWVMVDYFNVMGPLASRDIVMPIDLTGINGNDIHVKLECGFMFWEVDYASMDFSENIRVQQTQLAPAKAKDEKGNDVAGLLASTDNQYLFQPEVGNEAVLNYPAHDAKKGNTISTFIHSRGYYEYIRDYKNKPNPVTLRAFKKKGEFTRFSKKCYDNVLNGKGIIANSENSTDGN